MRIIESCAKCLYDRQLHMTDNEEYLAEIREILDNRSEDDSAPYLVYQFNKIYERYFGKRPSYRDVKKQYNDLVLSMEDSLRREIGKSADPLATALVYARIGNYIDFGAMNQVDEATFLSLFKDTEMSSKDREVFASFRSQASEAKNFLLIADNCGEIVLDRLFLEQLKKEYPQLEFSVMVRGGEVLNDATYEDAVYTGIHKMAKIVPNGNSVAGTVYDLLSEEARAELDKADLILAKGQGNYESMHHEAEHIFFSFLCKCDLFVYRFNVPRLTGILI